MLTLYRLFRRLTGAGSTEAKAAKWDRTADRMAKRKQEATMMYNLAVKASASNELISDIAIEIGQYAQAERNARTVAAEIRAGR